MPKKSKKTNLKLTRRGFVKVAAGAAAVTVISMPWVTTKAKAAGEINVVLNPFGIKPFPFMRLSGGRWVRLK